MDICLFLARFLNLRENNTNGFCHICYHVIFPNGVCKVTEFLKIQNEGYFGLNSTIRIRPLFHISAVKHIWKTCKSGQKRMGSVCQLEETRWCGRSEDHNTYCYFYSIIQHWINCKKGRQMKHPAPCIPPPNQSIMAHV